MMNVFDTVVPAVTVSLNFKYTIDEHAIFSAPKFYNNHKNAPKIVYSNITSEVNISRFMRNLTAQDYFVSLIIPIKAKFFWY